MTGVRPPGRRPHRAPRALLPCEVPEGRWPATNNVTRHGVWWCLDLGLRGFQTCRQVLPWAGRPVGGVFVAAAGVHEDDVTVAPDDCSCSAHSVPRVPVGDVVPPWGLRCAPRRPRGAEPQWLLLAGSGRCLTNRLLWGKAHGVVTRVTHRV